MPDIVEQLRLEGADAMRKHLSMGMWQLCSEAAAKIERLRAALEQLLDAHWPLVESADHEDENCRRARSALRR